MDRRHFFKGLGAVVVGLSGSGVAAFRLPHGAGRLQHLRLAVAEIGDPGEYLRLRAQLASHALNPWLCSWMQGLDHQLPRRFEALVEIAEESGEMKFGTLLMFSEWFDPEPDTPALTFVDWLPRFRPLGRDDFLMALDLYELYRHSGDILPTLRPTPDPWLDALLGSTRGMLFWRHQWIELVRVAGPMDVVRATQLVRNYLKRLPDAVPALEQIRYVETGQTLKQIIAERSPVLGVRAAPDHLAGDWLHRYVVAGRGMS